jgi:hypothetical protein
VQTPRRDAAKSSRTPQTRARRNGLSCTMLIHSILSPIRRLHEHSMVPADVCDGQEQARSTLDGREADLTGLVDSVCRRHLCNGLTVTNVRYNIRSSTRRLPEHRMVPSDVCDGQEQSRSTSGGREVDRTTRRCACQRRSRNGPTVTDVRYNIRSSTNGLPEHRKVPADVCDGQEQGRSTLYGREVDRTTRF